MADGVKIRIVGDDSEFQKTLETLEKRARKALRGVGAQLPSLSRELKRLVGSLSGRVQVGLSAAGDVAGGILGQKEQVEKAAGTLAAAAKAAMESAGGAYGAGADMAEGFRRGLAGRKNSIVAAAAEVAGAAVGAMRSTLEIRSPSRVTMQMGEYAGQGFEIGLTRSVQAAVRSAGRAAGELNLAPRMQAPAAVPAGQADAITAGRPIYLNVDGRTLAQVLGPQMEKTLNHRGQRIAAGRGR